MEILWEWIDPGTNEHDTTQVESLVYFPYNWAVYNPFYKDT